ncbi:EAL domain-containing protein [Tardiphaga sp. vice278]|uniref:EAL domain-containing protein n=1 Tax=Tardiphaga sp. vice278 TaxID=2592815 RepID=UPI00116355A2|nr:EAL domain-containing protein [Tardiphaga sp. vice278]QDM19093.1 EAL domain-containing protein [Tardiphaga sp. vice278]
MLKQKSRLVSAIDNMTQGLLLFDANKRVLICNQRYIELYGLSPKIVKPGCTLRDVLVHRQERGSLIGDIDKYCERVAKELLEGGKPFILSLADGRFIQIIDRPMASGGWVSTHEDITERRLFDKQIERLAHYDTLTGLPNRGIFLQRLASELESSHDIRVALLFIDVDDFKAVNDSLEHEAGDELLRAVALRLRVCADRPWDFVARLGGDEFVIIRRLSLIASEVDQLIADVFASLHEPIDLSGQRVRIDVSIGAAISPEHGDDASTLMRSADIAMYQAKAAGKNTHMIYHPAMAKSQNARRRLEADLRQAVLSGDIGGNGFSLVFQPLISISDGRITSCEALLRWSHPILGPISPEQFIPIAEESRLILELGEWALLQALARASQWPKSIGVAVNVSPVQFRSQSLALKVLKALAVSGVSPRRLELEITEAVLIGDDKTALLTLHELHTAGVQVALDDFGTGYSSLSYLQRFPFDKIKIDKTFINKVDHADGSAHIVRAIIDIATAQDMTTTAEGVETEMQLDALRRLGCTEMQGYLFSRPVLASEINDFLMKDVEKRRMISC